MEGIAIIGMAGRFPGAKDVAAFWENLKNGVDSISRFADAELEFAAQEDSAQAVINARGILEDAAMFDAAFFGVTPRDAELMDPQQRVFLECAWEALENAGYDPMRAPGLVGVWAGSSLNSYLLFNLCADRSYIEKLVAGYQQNGPADFLGNTPDFLATRVAYKLNLKGPALTVQTACSTSLVAIAQACQALLSYQADMALAGGVSISFPQKRAYPYQEGGMASADGRTRTFDAAAAGTVFSSASGVVVLKRLSDALADGDKIFAYVKGVAVNNDGNSKMSYTAPSADGQAEAITLAQTLAGVEPASISYVEAHGTATPLGDPIELAGLTQAFRAGGAQGNGYCAIGSVKTNIGHTESASGAVAIIKTALALHHRQIPPSLYFESPNPKLDLENSPFYVNSRLIDWPAGPDGQPRRAGVSNFGVGGTNAHAVLEEAPAPEPSEPSPRAAQLLVLSARTPTALDAAARNLAKHLATIGNDQSASGCSHGTPLPCLPPETPQQSETSTAEEQTRQRSAVATAGGGTEMATLDLADAAFTLQTGRSAFAHRRAVVARDAQDAARLLAGESANGSNGNSGNNAADAARLLNNPAAVRGEPAVAFLFPGQGAQFARMGEKLYRMEAVFREELDRCAEILRPLLDGADLREIIFFASSDNASASSDQDPRLDQTRFTQPALFAFGYALAKLWLSWGIRPRAMLGHSVGEYVAACLAGVFSLEDGLMLIAERARLVQAQAPGAMLAARLPEADLAAMLPEYGLSLSIAAVNAPGLCVASGPEEEIAALERRLETQRTPARRLRTSHAFHSAMMEPVVAPFTATLEKLTLRAPEIPFVSNVTGEFITDAQATDPHYWARHLREAVRFADGVGALLREKPGCVLLEIGPGQTLAPLAKQHPAAKASQTVTIGSLQEGRDDTETILSALGRLWTLGAEIDWTTFHAAARRQRMPLPTYPFERQRYWIEPPAPETARAMDAGFSISNSKSQISNSTTAPAAADSPTMNAPVLFPAPAAAPVSRLPKIVSRMKTILKNLSGQDQSAAPTDVSFLEQGFDSLFLTQVAQAFRKEFGVKVTFRQLLEDYPTMDALAAHLDAQLPPDPVATPVAVSAVAAPAQMNSGCSHGTPLPCPPLPNAATERNGHNEEPARQRSAVATAQYGASEQEPARQRSAVATAQNSVSGQAVASQPGGALERVIQEQLRVMAQQLEALRGAPAASPAHATQDQSAVDHLAAAERPNSAEPLDFAPAAVQHSAQDAAAASSASALPSAVSAFSIQHSALSSPKSFGPYRPIEKGPGGGFTAQQQAFLDDLISRYTARTPSSKKQTQQNRAHFADPRSVSGFRTFWKEAVYPIVVDRSAGARLWDIDGNEYIDLTMGFGTNLLGHSPAFIREAMEAQLQRGIEVGPQSPMAGKVAALLCEMTGAERAAFTNTGSEAVLAAVRLARTVTGRTRIATCGGFHGINDEVLVRAKVVDGQRTGAPVAPGIPEHIVKDVLVVDYGTSEGLEMLRAHAHELAAVLVEPVQSRRPDLQPREFMHELRRITKEAECALIFDEVITGFRCHPGGAQAYFGVQADLATWGKVMGGGLPVGAVTGRAEYMDALDGGAWQYGDASFPEVGVTFFAGTYIRHPLTMAASHAMLSYLKAQGPELQQRLNARTAAMVGELNEWFAQSGVPLRLESFASLFYPHFDDEIKYGSLLYFCLREKGIHLWEGRPCFLSTAHTDEDVRSIVRAFKESVAELQRGGFLPGAAKTNEEALGLSLSSRAKPRELPSWNAQENPGTSNGSLVSPVNDPAGNGTASLEGPSASLGMTEGKNAGDKLLKFSLYYFGNYPAEYRPDKYRLIIESAKFADAHGFAAVWLPERHFHALGGFSPNPSLLAAALARETKRIQLRGGSVVLPLHHPVRVAEEWALVDNLSGGRTGMSIATGWHPNDFIFAPERFERRKEICLEDIATIQRLWRGETIPMRAGAGSDFDVKLFPMPVQKELPVWLTCIHEDSFVKAGEQGMGVLGYLMNQTVEEVAAKIVKYREALARAGHDPAKGHVTILVHTFLGDDAEAARATAKQPLCDYLRSFLDNSQKRLESQNGPVDVSDEDVEYLLEKSFNDYVQGKALIGSPESCAAVVEQLREIGVDEIGCFVDFGVDADAALAALPALNALRERFATGTHEDSTQRREVAEIRREGEEGEGKREERKEQTLKLTEAQSGLWVLGQTDKDALRAYCESTTLEWKGALDLEALRGALQDAVDRHDALRTTIAPDGETQTVHPQMDVEMPLVDFSGVADEAERKMRLEAMFREMEAEGFDFARGPLMRARVIRLAAERHWLVLTFHHLLGNGPSYWVFFDELTALYEARRAGHSAGLEAPLQLGEFAQWREAEAAQNLAEDEAFWAETYAGGVPVLDLPTDHARPSLRTHRGARRQLTLPKELEAGLRRLAAARRGSLFMVLLTAFEALLHRLSGQEDVAVGVPFEGEARTLPGGERLFANTTNVMPLRSRAGENATFAELFSATKGLVLEANERQNYFFGKLIKKLNMPHDASRSPVFAAFFNYESGKFERTLDGGRLRVELKTDDGVPYRSPRDTAMFEIYLNVAEKDGELHCECDYSTDLFDGETISRWLGHYQTLLEAACADGGADAPVHRLPLLGADEQRQILIDWNGTRADYPLETLHELISAQAARSGDATALIFENKELSHRELERRSNQLANCLHKAGVGRGARVGVCMERSLGMVVALLGTLKAGAAYVPLDPDYPATRLDFMVGDIQAGALLTQEHLRDKLPAGYTGSIIVLDDSFRALDAESDALPRQESRMDDAAYIIYTSGSTGKPKGVINTHRNICNRLHWKQRAYPLTTQDRLMQKTPFTFDVSVPEFFAPLLAGATMVVARPRGHMDSDYLARLIAERGVTDIHFVPSMLGIFLEERDIAARCPTLRRVNCSGEALPGELVERFFKTFPTGVELLNLYGPTEAAVEVTYHACVPADARGNVPIGKPIANTQIRILDKLGQPVPIGAAGELHIGGANVAAGYLGRPELTAEKFVPDPFSPHDPNARLYKTGDLARWRPDGSVVYLGRMDHQVKIRGFRIELEEIETALNQHPAVRESAVLAREDRPGERRLAAYIVPNDGEVEASDLAAALRTHLKTRLPDYMMPAAFVPLASLPVTANGKLDRRALPMPDYSAPGSAADGESAAPRTPLESKLTELWARLLNLPRVGVNDNFFELGGDSLLGLKMVNQLRDQLKEHLSLVVVFEAPTVAALAELLEKNYAVAVEKHCGLSDAATVARAQAAQARETRLDEADVRRMREIIGHARPAIISRRGEYEAKNPPAVFILSPMRSGSTLLRIMLAGNWKLFSPPELQLLQFDTLAERADAFEGYDRYMQEGTVRAIMQIKNCSKDQAQAIMTEAEARGGSVRQFYRQMQDWVNPRVLVDKTPDYAMDLEVLRRAEEFFDGALYIHLARHPLGMIRSYEKGRFILESPYRGRHDFSARKLAELTWVISHQNILEFLKTVPAERQARVRFEDVVSAPKREMEKLGEFLGVGYDAGMIRPYEDQRAKMTDGVHEMSPQVGDFNYYQHGELKADVAERWKSDYREDFLGGLTWELAAKFGYENPFQQNEASQAAEVPAPAASTAAAPVTNGVANGNGLPSIMAVSREARRVKRSALAGE